MVVSHCYVQCVLCSASLRLCLVSHDDHVRVRAMQSLGCCQRRLTRLVPGAQGYFARLRFQDTAISELSAQRPGRWCWGCLFVYSCCVEMKYVRLQSQETWGLLQECDARCCAY